MARHCTEREQARLKKQAGRLRFKKPLRIRVLQSKIPRSVRSEIFEQLAEDDNPKLAEWATSALHIPFGTFSKLPEDRTAFLDAARVEMDAQIMGHENAKQEVLPRDTLLAREGKRRRLRRRSRRRAGGRQDELCQAGNREKHGTPLLLHQPRWRV